MHCTIFIGHENENHVVNSYILHTYIVCESYRKLKDITCSVRLVNHRLYNSAPSINEPVNKKDKK